MERTAVLGFVVGVAWRRFRSIMFAGASKRDQGVRTMLSR